MCLGETTLAPNGGVYMRDRFFESIHVQTTRFRRHNMNRPTSFGEGTDQSYMNDVSQILDRIENGDVLATEQLLPLVYKELRQLARAQLGKERAGQTLQATALVHEAYLKLVGSSSIPKWNSRGHFFAAAAEAMRRILVDRARSKARVKHGGEVRRVEFNELSIATEDKFEDLLAIDEALTELEQYDQQAAELVKLRYFAGMQHQEAADCLQISRRAADRLWLLARTWLFKQLDGSNG